LPGGLLQLVSGRILQTGKQVVCGIAGAVWWEPSKRIDRDVLQRMTDAIQHRGPDAEGHWQAEPNDSH